jgi:hypothetical protein
MSLKNVMSNYKQNANNYFKDMLGETAIVKHGGLRYGYLLILPLHIPYFSSDKKQYTHLETLNDTNIIKYVKLFETDVSQPLHKPDLFNIIINHGLNEVYENAINNKIKIENRK